MDLLSNALCPIGKSAKPDLEPDFPSQLAFSNKFLTLRFDANVQSFRAKHNSRLAVSLKSPFSYLEAVVAIGSFLKEKDQACQILTVSIDNRTTLIIHVVIKIPVQSRHHSLKNSRNFFICIRCSGFQRDIIDLAIIAISVISQKLHNVSVKLLRKSEESQGQTELVPRLLIDTPCLFFSVLLTRDHDGHYDCHDGTYGLYPSRRRLCLPRRINHCPDHSEGRHKQHREEPKLPHQLPWVTAQTESLAEHLSVLILIRIEIMKSPRHYVQRGEA